MPRRVDPSRCARRNAKDPPPDVLVALKAADQKGQITNDQLRACGLDRGAVLRRARAGRLHLTYPGVYAVGHAAVTREGRLMAAVLACGEAAYLSWFSAGMLLAYLPWEERLPHVTVVGTKARSVTGIHAHRARSLHWRDVMRHEGIPMIAPARTLLDLATVLKPAALRRAARRAQAAHLVNLAQLLEAMGRCNGHPGVRALRAVVSDGPAPTRSELEDVVLELLDNAGIERPEVNPGLLLDGSKVIPDFLWRDRRVVVEADGAAWHDHKLAREHDVARQATLEAHGYRLVRVTWTQAVEHPHQTLARIRAALADG